MKNDSDRKTFKMKNNRKKKENNSNSSRESLEIEIRSHKNYPKISKKKTAEGEEIKFFFNDPPVKKKNSKFEIAPLSSVKTVPRPNFIVSKEKNEFNFRDILLNYVNSPECHTKRKDQEKREKVERRKSIIYGDPITVLTLNGDENSNNSVIKEKDESSVNSYSRESNTSSEVKYTNKDSNKEGKNHIKSQKSQKKEEVNTSKNSSYKISTSKYNDYDSSNYVINNKDDDEEECNIEKNDISNNKMEKCSEFNQFSNKNKKISLESNILKNNKDSCINSYKHSQNIKGSNSNTFTTTMATNTINTHKTDNTNKTQNSSFQSLKINNKKKNYNYLCWNDLSFEKKLKIKNRSNSVKQIKIKNIKEIPKEDFIKDENTSIMLYKLKNLDISLDIEKSYSYYFKNLTKLQNQKSRFKNNFNKKKKSNEQNKEKSENSFYYPDEYYINKNNSLHQKSHISNLFDKLRDYRNNS